MKIVASSSEMDKYWGVQGLFHIIVALNIVDNDFDDDMPGAYVFDYIDRMNKLEL